MRVTDKHIFFWGEFPSNWHPTHFVVKEGMNELEFFNSEQYFMYIKAKTFGDEEIATKILTEGKNPKTAKGLGRKVRNYDDSVWNDKRYQVMVDANMYKFSQDEKLKALLMNPEFDGKNFVEASPYDGIWGIKCDEATASDDESTWNGLNLLGKALDDVRDKLKEKSAI
jgi:ribA/ribD-fused uncharacterized protein